MHACVGVCGCVYVGRGVRRVCVCGVRRSVFVCVCVCVCVWCVWGGGVQAVWCVCVVCASSVCGVLCVFGVCVCACVEGVCTPCLCVVRGSVWCVHMCGVCKCCVCVCVCMCVCVCLCVCVCGVHAVSVWVSV